jgi:uncharacterized protein (TIGR03435 family)
MAAKLSVSAALLAARAVIALGGGTGLWAQSVEETSLRFEVASVKPSAFVPSGGAAPGERASAAVGGGCPQRLRVDRGRVEIRCATLAMLVGYAFRMSPDRLSGPDWMMSPRSPRFEIEARIPNGAALTQIPEMIQALLVERFKLVFHRGSSNSVVYALVVMKGGLKLKPAAPDPADGRTPDSTSEPDASPAVDEFFGGVQTHTAQKTDGSMATTIFSPRIGTVQQTGDPFGIQRWEGASISLEGLADLLDQVAPISVPVMDMTGLKGRFRMVLEVSLRDAQPGMVSAIPNSTGGESEMENVVVRAFNDGLRKLGLRLERRKGPVEAIVVDHLEKAPTEN